MTSSRKDSKEKKVFDVHKASRPSSKNILKHILYGKNALNLRPNFRVRHPWVWILGCLALVVAVFFGVRLLSLRADVQDFYPSICLGDWQNPANAQGRPETMATGTPFSAENSALSNGSDTQIFCGGFLSGDIPTSSNITNVGLTFMWQIGDETASATTVTATTTTSTAAAAPSDEANGTSSPDFTSSTSSSATSASSMENIEEGEPTTTVPTTSITTATSVVPTDTAPIVVPDTEASGTSSDAAPVDNSSSGNMETPPVVTPPPPSPPLPPPAPTNDTNDSTTSFISPPEFFSWAVPAARADDDASQTVILGEPLIANLLSETSTPTSSASTSSEETIASTSTTATAATAPPATPDENFLDVSYSTDGQTWVSIGEVNVDNWQEFTVTLPISHWTDLQNLQIRVQGIPTTQDPLPPVYLDGMLVEVHYELPSVAETPVTPSSTDEEVSSTAPPVRITLVNPGAQQTCEIEPFSQELPLGGTAQFIAVLHPSINGISYDLSTGYLPHGVVVLVGSPTGPIAATSSLTFRAAADAQHGSFNISVIYHEHEADGNVISNFCQLNIIVR